MPGPLLKNKICKQSQWQPAGHNIYAGGGARKTGIMVNLYINITGNGQELLLSITYGCDISDGIASYNVMVECSVEQPAPFDPGVSASCVFSFCRDAYWNALCEANIHELHGYATAILKDVLIKVARAIMEYEEKSN
jgi:hypothetical protein